MAKQHLKKLIHNLLTQSDKLQAINATLATTKDPQAKNDLIKIKNKYFNKEQKNDNSQKK